MDNPIAVIRACAQAMRIFGRSDAAAEVDRAADELERLRAAQPAVPDAMTMPTGSHDALVQSFVNGWNACRNQMLAASQRKEGA